MGPARSSGITAPSRPTTGAAIASSRTIPAPAPRRHPPRPPSREPAVHAGTARPLIGRSAEVALATECLEAVSKGEPRILTVAGEAGIGKTAICEHSATLAAERGMRVAWGRCSELPGVPAYWPYIQIFRKLLEVSSNEVRKQLGSEHPGVQELVTSLAFTSPAFAGDGEQARFRFFDSVTRFVEKTA